jgi:hypothetical protein
VNRIKEGGNYAWGPHETCAGSAPLNTNQDGPVPRRLPKFLQVDTSGFTGAAVCFGCGLPTELDLYYGAVNTGEIHRITLDGTRKKVTGDSLFWDHSGPVLSVETRPGQPIYFSDTTAIYKLVNP